MRYLYYVAPAVAALATMGTFARAGIIAGIVWVVIAWWHSRRKIALIFFLLGGMVALQPLMGERWTRRMSTTVDARKNSALVRLLAWEMDLELRQSQSPRRQVQFLSRKLRRDRAA